MRNLGYCLLRSLVKLVASMPFGVLYAISDILYYPLYYVVRYRRKITRKNLTESFPDKSPAEIERIEKGFYHFFVDMALESCKLVTMSHEDMKKHLKFVNMDMVNAVLKDGHSISTFLGHYGNWEWMSSIGLWLCDEAVCAQIYHKLRNKAMDRLMIELRSRMGNTCVEMHSTARYINNATHDNRPYIIGFIADQSPKKREAKDYLGFLGHQVPVLTGTEKITKRYGYKAMYVSVKRVKRGYYECEFQTLHDDPQSLPDYELTDLYFKRLESEIRRQPELYLWTHNRFKHAKK